MTRPVHSVIIPVLNGARHIGEALTSALAQLGPSDEILVVDNGSTDGTPELVAAFGDPRIRLLHAEKRGPAAARNVAMAVAAGQWISFLDHDDYWPDGRQEGLMATLAADPSADAAYGRLRVKVEPGCIDQGLSRLDGTHSPAVGLHAHMFSRALLERTGLMDESMPLGSDVDYLARLNGAGMRSAIYDGDAAVYRRHNTNLTLDAEGRAKGLMTALARSISRKRLANG